MYYLQISGNMGIELATPALTYAQRKAREWSCTQTITLWHNDKVYAVYKYWLKIALAAVERGF